MHFDDRLDTVLRQPVRGREMARVQFVQLLDLLGKAEAEADSERLDPAYARLSALAGELPATARADLLRASGLKLRSPALVAFLAGDAPAVASAAIGAAELDEKQWLDLVPALPVASRGILRHRRDLGPAVEARLARLGVADRGLPGTLDLGAFATVDALAPVQTDAPAEEQARPHTATVTPLVPPAPAQGESGIGALVRRIEAYRKSHPSVPDTPANDAPRLPLGDQDLLPAQKVHRFDFVTDAEGRIVRAGASAAPMLVGTALGSLPCRRVDSPAPKPVDAVRLRQPIDSQVVTIDGAPAISGDWRIDAAPMFDAATGRFTGHAGRARRLPAQSPGDSHASEAADRMRQVLHELRNPAGAIQMASEFIQQQVGGSVPHEYRSIAAAIASDTATVLGGLDEVDRLVKCDAGVIALEPGETDFAANVAASVTLLERTMAQRESGFALEGADHAMPVAIARGDLERLTWRLLAAVAGAVGPVETLPLRIGARGDFARLEIALPASLRDLTDEDLFIAQARDRGPALSAGMFGLGFTLRLAAAEARSAGGLLVREGERLILTLPMSEVPSANVRGA